MDVLKAESYNLATGDCYMYDGTNAPNCYMDAPACTGSISD